MIVLSIFFFFLALLTDSFIILSFFAQNKLCFIQFTKKMGSPDVNKRLEKLSALDYKVEISIYIVILLIIKIYQSITWVDIMLIILEHSGFQKNQSYYRIKLTSLETVAILSFLFYFH